MPIIEVHNVSKDFADDKNKIKALDNVNFNIDEHEFVCIVGPSGCGKSTLLRLLAGLDFPTSGMIKIKDEEVDGPDPKRAALIFQTFGLLPWRTVSENIELGLQAVGTIKQTRDQIIEKYVKLMDLEEFSDARPYELSGGMKQRVGIARALAVEPQVLLMDEPFSALDAITADMLRKDVLEVWADPSTKTNTFIMITHLIEEAVFMADKVIVMSKRPGRVLKEVEVTIPRPRVEHARDPAFFELCDEIRNLIG
ncbi:ABC transporter ATP-binding protein [Candidatus Micrarchaeota archaeon]|nr:ABC transporter ATP-binding protein [Candidatus Micrarchaeota archaeon]